MRTEDKKTGTEPAKLFELRAKTDRQLVAFITNRLAAGLRLACLDTDREEAGKIYGEVSALLPWVRGLSKAESRLLESRLAQLREFLDDFSSDAEWKTQTACS
jgi:hypothetical protein